MITFQTQDEFEAAVMAVIKEKLRIGVTVYSKYMGWHDKEKSTQVEVSLKDQDNVPFYTDEDYA